MRDFFKELFEYSHHVNQALGIVFVNESGEISDKAHSLYCHLLNAHHIWNNRVLARDPLYGVWELHPVEKRLKMDKENYSHTLSILDGLDLSQTVSYSNSKGQHFTNSIRDILCHVINHSTYHRGQLATEFKNSGIEPISTDYILYKR